MTTVNLEFLTKVLPPRRRPNILRRQRLVDFLHEHVNLRAQIICAPAGYGKTTLLVDFASDVDIPVCWYSLDTSDQDPAIFLDTLITAIRYRFPDFGRRTENRLRTSADIVREVGHIIGLLAGEMYTNIPELFILVLEDYHSIESDNTIKSVLDLLIYRAPDNCHFIISSRTPIDMPVLARLSIRRELAKLGTSELSFTPTEIKQLLQDYYKVGLSETEANKLATASEGWVAGILLGVSTSFPGQSTDGKVLLSSQDVFNYLASEVYEKQPSEIKGFLLCSSIFWEIEPQYCERLFKIKISEQLLLDIERRNLFLSKLEGERVLYRYHNLFREFLQSKLRREQPETYLFLHRDAGSILEVEGRWNEAISHYMVAGEYTDAVGIIKNLAEPLLKAGKWQTVSRWIQALPDKVKNSEPVLALFEAESLIHLGQVDKAIQLLNKVMSQLDITQSWLTITKALNWRSAAFRLTGYFTQAIDDAKKAIRILKERHGPAEVLGDAYRRLGTIYVDQGKLSEAEKNLRRSIKFFLSGFDVNQIATAYNALGVVYKRLGQLDKASAQYEQARQYWEKAHNEGALALTLNNMGVVYRRLGQYELALNTLNNGLEKARLTGYQRTESLLLINMADVKRDLGQYAEALSLYSQALELARQVMEPSQVAIAISGIGESYRLLGQLDRAEVLLREALAQAQERGQAYDAALFNLQLGILRYQQGQLKKAEELLANVHAFLERSGDKDATARCALHLARVSYLSKRYRNALSWLKKVAELADGLGYDQFLLVEGATMPELFKYAVSRRVGGEPFERILKGIEKRASSEAKGTGAPEQSASRPENLPQVEVHSLGECAVLVNSTPVSDSKWRSAKAKEMFFFLLCENKLTSKEQVLAALWPDISPAKGNSLFHSNLYRLRRALFDRVIINQNGHYLRLPGVPVWYDAREYQSHLSKARGSPFASESWVRHLELASELYKGSFLKEFYSDWVENLRRQLEDTFIEVQSSLASYHLKQGRHGRAIEMLEKALAADPYQEQLYCELADCHLAVGDRASAQMVCQRYTKMLGEEIGSGPWQKILGLPPAVVKGKQVTGL